MLSGDVDGHAEPGLPEVTPKCHGRLVCLAAPEVPPEEIRPMRTPFAALAFTALLFSAGCGSGDDSDAAVPQEAAAEGGGGDASKSEAAAPASEAGSETGSEASTKPSEGGSEAAD